MTVALTETVDLVTRLSRALTSRAMYPEGHPSVDGAVSDFLGSLDACLTKRKADEVTFLVIDRDLVVDDRPLRTKSIHLRPFVRIMSRHGVQRLTFTRGLSVEESNRFLSALAVEGDPSSSEHVDLGKIRLGGDGTGGPTPAGWGEDLSEQDLDRGQDAFAGFGQDREGSIEELDRLVWRVLEGLASSSRSLLLLAPVKGFDQYLFLHSVNVSVLAVGLARGLGIEGTTLHEIGMAALLHDLGKTALPADLWRREGRLSEEEWQRAQLHPELGAAMLCGSESAPPLAVLVAYEHHLRWDGKPSYPACGRTPNLASQITAVADTWDALAAGRLARPGPEREGALALWRQRSGTYLDPFLVGHFLLLLTEAGEQPG